eukprot:gene9960-12212_t
MDNHSSSTTTTTTTTVSSESINELEKYIESLKLIDHHCHNILKEPQCFTIPLVSSLCESDLSTNQKFLEQSKSSLIYKRSIKELYELYNCNSSVVSNGIKQSQQQQFLETNKIENVVEKKRREMGLEQITSHCFERSGIESIILDYSLKITFNNTEYPIMSNQWHQKFCKVYKILRLESILEDSLVIAKKSGLDFTRWKQLLIDRIDPNTVNEEEGDDGVPIVGYKSIVAYRTGLEVKQYSLEQVEEEFLRVLEMEVVSTQENYRVSSQVLINFYIHLTLHFNAQREHPLPLQIHTGYGDNDLDLEKSNPLLLKQLIMAYPTVPIVLLHCSYPYVKEAGYLCWVFPNAYIDIGLAIPYLSVAGMTRSLSELMELTPIDKMIYSSDAHHIPDIFYLSSKWARKSVFNNQCCKFI